MALNIRFMTTSRESSRSASTVARPSMRGTATAPYAKRRSTPW